jgi:hypothetical protein
MPSTLDFDAAGVLAAVRAKSAPEPGTPPNPPNHLIGAGGEATGLGGLGGLGEGRLPDRIFGPAAARVAFYLPALEWLAMPFGPERGRAFAEARQAPGACSCCAGRTWWRYQGEAGAPTCRTCHPPPLSAAVDITDMDGTPRTKEATHG